jgi:hypothetical protein
LTAHVTAVLLAFVTVTVNACELPRSTEALAGDRLMVTGGELWGGAADTRPVPPDTQPCAHAIAANAAHSIHEQAVMPRAELGFALAASSGKTWRMPSALQANGQRKQGRVGGSYADL